MNRFAHHNTSLVSRNQIPAEPHLSVERLSGDRWADNLMENILFSPSPSTKPLKVLSTHTIPYSRATQRCCMRLKFVRSLAPKSILSAMPNPQRQSVRNEWKAVSRKSGGSEFYERSTDH